MSVALRVLGPARVDRPGSRRRGLGRARGASPWPARLARPGSRRRGCSPAPGNRRRGLGRARGGSPWPARLRPRARQQAARPRQGPRRLALACAAPPAPGNWRRGLGRARGGSPCLRGSARPGSRRRGCLPAPGSSKPGLGRARGRADALRPDRRDGSPGLRGFSATDEDDAASALGGLHRQRRLMGQNPNCHPLKRPRTPIDGPVYLLMS
jgi:hypothetical protein